jgi:hypothetical protein
MLENDQAKGPARDVHADPVFRIFVSIDLPRIWPVGIAFAQAF